MGEPVATYDSGGLSGYDWQTGTWPRASGGMHVNSEVIREIPGLTLQDAFGRILRRARSNPHAPSIGAAFSAARTAPGEIHADRLVVAHLHRGDCCSGHSRRA